MPVDVPVPKRVAHPSPAGEKGLVGRVPAGDPFATRMARAALELVTTAASTRELADLVALVQAPVTTGRRIAVTSVSGGAGRTTVTALLGEVFAARRADHVLVADDDPDGAGLAWRLGLDVDADPRATAARLLAARGGSLTAVDAILPGTAAGLRVFTGPGPAAGPGTAQVVEGLSRFFAIALLDSPRVGHAAPRPVTAAAGPSADVHATVLTCPFSPAGLRGVVAALERGAVRPDVVVLVANDRTGRSAVRASAVKELEGHGAEVVALPYDRHLAAGTRVDPARLGRATVLAATRLAGIALERATR